MQQRDRYIFGELAHLKLASTAQCVTLGRFSSYSRAKDRLRRLLYGGFLRRCFIGTISGGKQAVYALSPKAATLLGVTAPNIQFRNNQLLTSDQYIRHELFIVDVYLAVRYNPLPDGVSFLRWRRFSGPLAETIRLIPDGYCELQTPQGIRCCFLEVDLGSEALHIWQQKIQSYLELAVSGSFERLSGQNQFRVLILATTERRLLHIRQKVAAATDKIFWLATLSDISERGLWACVWWRPSDNARHTLL